MARCWRFCLFVPLCFLLQPGVSLAEVVEDLEQEVEEALLGGAEPYLAAPEEEPEEDPERDPEDEVPQVLIDVPVESREAAPDADEAENRIDVHEAEGEALVDEEPWPEDEQGVVVDDDSGQAYRVAGPCGDWLGDTGELRWVDQSHAMISRGLCWPTRWFDGFFGNPDDEIRASAGTYLSITMGQRWQEHDADGQRLSYSSRISLPGLQRRLSLVFSSEDEEVTDRFASDEEEEETAFRAGLRWAVRTTERMDLDADATLTSDVRPLFRVRYRQRWPITEHWALRFSETLTWRDPQGMASRTQFDFSRPLTSRSVLRLDTRTDWSEERFPEQGWYVRQTISVSTRLNQRSALLYQVLTDGVTRPEPEAERYLASVRYRRNVWRPWLFYEIEPFVLWSREFDFEPSRGLWLRLESRWGQY